MRGKGGVNVNSLSELHELAIHMLEGELRGEGEGEERYFETYLMLYKAFNTYS